MSETDKTTSHPDTKCWNTRFLNQRRSWSLQTQGSRFAGLALSRKHRSLILPIREGLGWRHLLNDTGLVKKCSLGQGIPESHFQQQNLPLLP